MTQTQNKYLYGGIVLAVIGLMVAMSYQALNVKATILGFSPSTCYTAAATTTLTYMSYGTATTTVTCMTGGDGAQSAALIIQVNASTTATTFNVFTEESMNGIDWYPTSFVSMATTSKSYDMTTRQFATFRFASSTIGGTGKGVSSNRLGVTGKDNRNNYSIDLNTRMRYVRAYIVATVVGATGRGGVWMQIIPRQPVN